MPRLTFIIVLLPFFFLLSGCGAILDSNRSLGLEVRQINAKPVAEARSILANKTIRHYQPGPQSCTPIPVGKYMTFSCYSTGPGTSWVIYLSPDGRSYRWDSSDSSVDTGLWRLARRTNRYAVCIQESVSSGVLAVWTDSSDQKCTDLAVFVSHVKEVRDGDIFGLAYGGPSVSLANAENFDELLKAVAVPTEPQQEIRAPRIVTEADRQENQRAAIRSLIAKIRKRFAPTPGNVEAFLNNTTAIFFDPYCESINCKKKRKGHGTQVEYFDESGKAYLWYPGNNGPVISDWLIERKGEGHELCFRYPRNSYNPVTKSRGGEWSCRDLDVFAERIWDKRSQDVFGLSQGKIPFVLPKTLTCLAALEDRMNGGTGTIAVCLK